MSLEPISRTPSPLPAPNANGKLSLLLISDLHLPKSAAAEILGNRRYLNRHDFAVLMGDMTGCYGTDKEYGFVNQFVSELELPYRPITGNHEWYFELYNEDDSLYGMVWAKAKPEFQRTQLEKFEAFYQLDSRWRAYENDLGHFVFLSIDEVKGAFHEHRHGEQQYASPSPGQPEALSEDQLDFLELQVRRAGDKPLYVFCHAPLMLEHRLDMVYYDEQRTGCIEAVDPIKRLLLERNAHTLWMSGHVHLRPDHYLSTPYRAGGNVWQIHCPDSWGYGRWLREQRIPQRYEGLFSKHLEIDVTGVTIVAHDHLKQRDVSSHRISFSS